MSDAEAGGAAEQAKTPARQGSTGRSGGTARGGDTAPTPHIDTSVASIARVYDAVLGGKDNFEVDRVVRDEVRELSPESILAARDGREFLRRVTRYLTRSIGIDQFLDCGSGLPTVENTHQIAQTLNPEARVVYVDNDPAVLAHGRALLGETEATHFVLGDLTEVDDLLAAPEVTANIDFTRPMALYQIGTLHHVPDERKPREIMARYIDAVPSGSYVALTHFFNPRDGGELGAFADEAERIYTNSSMRSGWFRAGAEILDMLEGLEVLHPGLVPVGEWWPAGPRCEPLSFAQRVYVGAVARKP